MEEKNEERGIKINTGKTNMLILGRNVKSHYWLLQLPLQDL